jgi:hypothetical protein
VYLTVFDASVVSRDVYFSVDLYNKCNQEIKDHLYSFSTIFDLFILIKRLRTNMCVPDTVVSRDVYFSVDLYKSVIKR